MTYRNLKAAIERANTEYQSGQMTAEEYRAFREQKERMMGVFLRTNRLTQEQYDELEGMFIEV
jgi:hypothetical protein